MTARNPTGRSERAVRAVATLALLAASALAHAQIDADALRACASEKDDGRRLACYDQAMSVRKAPAAAATAAASETPAAAPPAAIPAPETEAKFGYRGAIARKDLDEQAQREAGADRIEAAVVGLDRRAHGELVLTLDNGQVWAQKTAEAARVKVGDRIAIKKASFGSFVLVLPNNRSVRVTREK